ncbi:MAG: hypothetical protein KDC80_15550 [Saprospiraceae bacterium]|nr:hypothetical protein [Saprospiraceae bacterium]
MKREFDNYSTAMSWIAMHAITKNHLMILREELTLNFRSTGSYFIHTIVSEQ